MANGDEFQPPTESDQSTEPTTTGPTDGSGAGSPSGLSGIDEGWGEGIATIDEVFDNVKAVFRGIQGDILMAWLVFAGVGLLFETVRIGVNSLAMLSPALSLFGLLSIPLLFVGIFVNFFVIAAQFSLYADVREKVFHGIDPDGWNEAVRGIRNNVFQVFLAVVTISLVIPITCVIPGLVLAFFGVMSPYLIATNDLGVIDAFKRSYELAKKYWQVVAVAIGAIFGGAVLMACFGGMSMGLAMIPGPIGLILSSYAGWFGMTVFQFFVFVVWGAVFVTVDANESGQTVRV